jgi:two-component system, OmpR family, sensor histidine kinase TctE
VTSSIGRRLIFWLTVPLMLMALCGSLVHYFNNIAPGVINSDRRLKDAANSLMTHVFVKEGAVTLDSSPDRKPPLPAADSVRFALRDTQGRLLAGDAQLPIVTMNDETSQLLSMSQVDQRSLRTLTTRFDTRAGVIFITVADVHPPSEPAVRYGFMSTLLWDFVQLDVTLVLVWIGIQLGLRPVKKLRDEIAARSPLDLRPLVETSVPREIAPVVVTLNRLFATLRAAAQSQQQFIANTAHQLRTPITGMQAQLDLLAAEPAAQPVKNRVQTLQEGIRQLARAANQLLTLARADPTANIAIKNQQVDLGGLVSEVVAKFIDRALQSDIDLGVDIKPAAIVADPSLLDDLLSNLVDNALKYTPPGGRVTATAGLLNDKPFVSVEDSGPGIPEGERQRVRQRFYRMPNSAGHGSGLGLAIVDEIAALYGALVTLDSGANGRGTKVLVQFPDSAATHR